LGWALITHAFHPFFDQRFQILKSRQVAGRETLILKGTERGTFAVLRDWTDQAKPAIAAAGFLDVERLTELVDLIEAFKKKTSLTGVDS